MNESSLIIKIVDDIQKAKIIWEELSPKKSLYDDWEFRYCFFSHKKFPIKFFVGEYQEKNIGLLPLQFNSEKGYLEFFGGEYMDENKVFITPGWEEYVPKFYEAANEKAYFDNLERNHIFIIQKQIKNYIYNLPLGNIKDHNDFIEKKFKGSIEHRRKLRREIKKISEKDIKVIKNNFDDIDIYFKFKIKRWGAESSFNDKDERQNFIDFLKLKYNYHVFTFMLGEKKIGISISILFRNKYFFLETASDIELLPNIGKYIIIKNIDEAINLGAKNFDVSRDGESWKERWNFEKIPQSSFRNY
ncbi:MAG: GNAT family N-acetyltransferase [Patescibacteria group bacterium]|nr:GNAT family N-acetyltransferase [Patescibacteria group bacterium]